MTTMTQTNTRNSSLQDLVDLLSAQNVDKHDAVIPLQAITSNGGILYVAGMGMDGPAGEPGLFRPTPIMDGHMADRLGIPVKYLRWLRENRIDLYDLNVNGLIHGYADLGGEGEATYEMVDANGDVVMLRTFANQAGGIGIARCMMSDRYGCYDNLDMVFALLAGVRDSGMEVEVTSCDLSERRMIIRMEAPNLLIEAADLMKGYRSPFGSSSGGTYGTYNVTARAEGKKAGDCVGGGIVATNSETGGGAWSTAPYLRFLSCGNGLTINKFIMRQVHLGGKLEEGIIKWTAETEERNLALIAAKTKDAVTSFLDEGFIQKILDGLTEKAVKPIKNAAEMVELVSRELHYTAEQQAGILDHFIKGAQVTCGGIMHAVTSWAQEVEDSDTAFDFESSAIDAMEVAYANS